MKNWTDPFFFLLDPFFFLLQNRVDVSRGITYTQAYDDQLRLKTQTAAGSSEVASVTREYTYDALSRMTHVEESVDTTGIQHLAGIDVPELPSTSVEYDYDPYSQIIREQIFVEGESRSNHSDLRQTWDAAGRRSRLYHSRAESPFGNGFTQTFEYRADGRLRATTDALGQRYIFGYNTSGTLIQRQTPDFTCSVTSLDGRNRILGLETRRPQDYLADPGGILISESQSWYNHSRLQSYQINRTGLPTGSRLRASENRTYTYNARDQLLSESWQMQDGNRSLTYDFDNDQLGVRTGMTLDNDSNQSWSVDQNDATAYSNYAQINKASIFGLVQHKPAYQAGQAQFAENVFITIDEIDASTGTPAGNPQQITTWFDNTSPDGYWFGEAMLENAKAYQFQAEADIFASDGNGTLRTTTNVPADTWSSQETAADYDEAGYTTQRAWFDVGGDSPGEWSRQELVWDAFGRLIYVSFRRDTAERKDGYDWTAVYDAFGRRLYTETIPTFQNVAYPELKARSNSLYDPMVEFLEIGVTYRGQRTWKVHGPDLNGLYGGLQGIGGILAFIDPDTRATTPFITDAFGHTVAHIETGGAITWNETEMNGYGPLAGEELKYLSHFTAIEDATLWRGKRPDPTGLYYMGKRYYDPIGGRFISPDPLG
ncbi:MAG: RHS repeat-associated core domain-containing protein, partial [Verrucomicrobiota bacterium]